MCDTTRRVIFAKRPEAGVDDSTFFEMQGHADPGTEDGDILVRKHLHIGRSLYARAHERCEVVMPQGSSLAKSCSAVLSARL